MVEWYDFTFLYFHWLESTRAFYFYLFLSRTDFCTFSLTHPVIRHVTFLQYIVSSVTCLYLSFLLSGNPTLLDRCVFADKLGYLKSFSLRGTLPRKGNSPTSVLRPPSPRSSEYGPRRFRE